MPIVQLTTNVKVDDAKAFSVKLSKAAADVFGMAGFITSSVNFQETLTFAGTLEPAFVLSLTTLGNSPEKHDVFAKSLFDFLGKELNVPSDRGYVVFNDPGADRIAYKGMTYKTLVSGA